MNFRRLILAWSRDSARDCARIIQYGAKLTIEFLRQLNGSALYVWKEKSCQETTDPLLAVIRAGETTALLSDLSPGRFFWKEELLVYKGWN